MRGFRTNRAMQNQKSSHLGNQNQEQIKLKLIQGGLHEEGEKTGGPQKINLPDWMRVPKSLLEAQNGELKVVKRSASTAKKKSVAKSSVSSIKTRSRAKKAA